MFCIDVCFLTTDYIFWNPSQTTTPWDVSTTPLLPHHTYPGYNCPIGVKRTIELAEMQLSAGLITISKYSVNIFPLLFMVLLM